MTTSVKSILQKYEQGISLVKPIIITSVLFPFDKACSNNWAVSSSFADGFIEEANKKIRTFGIPYVAGHMIQDTFSVIGRVRNLWREGNYVMFEAETADARVITHLLRGYLKFNSASITSNNVTCSQCGEKSMKNGVLVHLCSSDAYHVVHAGDLTEISLIPIPAFSDAAILSIEPLDEDL